MPWVLGFDVQVQSGSKIDTGVTINEGQWIAAWIDPWTNTQVDPWGVLQIGVALPSISGAAPILDHKLLYSKLEAYYARVGVGNLAKVWIYIRDGYPNVSVGVRIYKWT